MKQTAVEWLEQILKQNCGAEFTELNTQIFDRAKEIEKQQIVDSWFDGTDQWCETTMDKAEEYYNETYKIL
jgi:hypothetical protein